jgi:hypothetical protein
MTCPVCHEKDRRIAQLERDLEQAQMAVTTMTNRWLEAREGKGKNG